MASRSINAAGRRLSLDINAASRMNDERIKVWTTQNFNQQNGSSPRPDFRNTDSNSGPRKLSLFLQRKQKRDGVKKVERRKREVRQQTSETRLSCIEKFATWRYVMVLLLQSSFMVTLFLRNTLPMSIVCMVRPRSSSVLTGSDRLSNASSEENFNERIGVVGHGLWNVSSNRNNTQHENDNYEFDWDPEIQGLILTSIMFTSFLAPLLGTVMASRLGSKWSLTLNNLLSTVLTFFSPTAARISPYCLVVVRVLLGLLAGGNVAVVVDCVAWWAPQDEKLTMISLSFTGINIGNILASVLSGYLCLVPLDNGWPFVFYTFGAITLVWAMLWQFLSSQKPEDHPYISEKEKQYIVSHRVGMDAPTGTNKAKPPYGKILKSRPTLAYITTGICHIWATQVMFTYLPMFFSKGLTFSVQDTGLLVSLTSLFRMLGTFFWTLLGNKLTALLDVKRSRKICICIGYSVAGLTSIVVGFVDARLKWVSTAVLICLMLCQSVGSSTITAVPLDMAPRYASLLNGLMVSTGSLIAISGPLLTAGIIEDGAHENWRPVWIVMGVIFLMGATTFLFFGQAALQPYALGKDSSAPHIVSPFVTMGRRFSTFIEAPPLSPVTPGKEFNITQNYQSPAATVLLATVSPEIFYAENLNVNNNNTIPIDSNELDKETEGSVTTDEDERIDESYSDVEITDEVNVPARRRAFSEFGLEVLKSSTIHVEKEGSLDAGRNVFFKQFEVLGSKDAISLKVEDVEVNGEVRSISAGVTNEAFQNDEGKSSVEAIEYQISRL